MNKEQRTKNKIKVPHSPMRRCRTPTPHSLFFFVLCSLFSALSLIAQNEPDSTEAVRLNTLKYGTETEIAALIQTLKTEGADYLDNEIIALVENTRNQRILSGAFSFFGEREKNGLEHRAIRAIEERENERNETILASIDYLGRIKDPNAAPVLQKLIEGSERRFVNVSIRAYGRISGSGSGAAASTDASASSDAVEYLIDFYENRVSDDENKREVIVALGATGSSGAVEFLAGIASDNDMKPTLRMVALESIAKIGAATGGGVASGSATYGGMQAGLDAVLAGVGDGDPNVRAAAVTALGPFSGDAVDAAILDAFRDSNYRSRIAAAQASRQRKLAAAVPYLKFRAERDEVPAVKDDSIRALGAIADGESLKVLESLFTERKNNDRVRILSGEMLMQIDPGKFLDGFVKELDEAKQKNQTALYNGFLKIIGGTKSSGLEAITLRLMQDKGVVERSYSLDLAANNYLTGLSEEIKRITSDKNESLAAKARRTLEKLGVQ
jgi:HEAT repeat protein